MKAIEELLGSIRLGETLTFKGLEIKPIFTTSDKALPYLTLEEAIGRNLLEITEVDESGHVPELYVKNKGTVDVLILEGEQVCGAKQNRIVNTSIIVPAGKEILIPVTCVEQGRWHYNSRSFRAAENVAYSSLRSASHKAVKFNLRRASGYSSNQGMVWDNIESKMNRLNVDSDSSAMEDIVMCSMPPETQDEMFHEIPFQEGQVGYLAYINGGFAGGDIFGSSELCRRQLNKLMKGYFLDAVDDEVSFPHIPVEEILDELTHAHHESYDAIGKGSEGRYEAEKIEGAYKVDEEVVTHMTVFPK